ncbi:MAG: hypothetical protein LDL31_00765 [Prosthecobacter sp.]|nr:hypothetical protein [Prosthecobacter sp.]
MQGFLWLITQMALLLTAAAFLFFWLGWRWGSRRAPSVPSAEVAPPAADIPAPPAASQPPEEQEATKRLRTQLEEAEHHRRNLEKELIRVHEELKTARQDAAQDKQNAQAAKAEAARLSTELTQLQRQNKSLEKQLATAQSAATASGATPSAPTAPPRAPRAKKNSPSPKPKAAAPLDATATLERIVTSLQAKQQLLTALQQEHEDWQRRLNTLRASGKDAPGLDLARKSLERVQQQMTETQTSLSHLQQQQAALQRSLQTAATLSHEDDLTRIKGIKAVLHSQLRSLGIKTFQQIASWTEEDTQAFGRLLGFKDRAKRDAWVSQARQLAEQTEHPS